MRWATHKHLCHTHTHSGCTVRANAQQRHPKPKHLCFVLNSFSCKFVFHFCSGRGPQFWDQNWFQFWDQIWFRADLYLILIVFKVGPSFGPKFGTEFGPKIRNHFFISVSFVCQFWFNLSHTIARLRVVFAAGRPPALVPHIIGVRSVRIHSSGTHTHQVRHVHIGHSFCKFVFRDRFHCALFSRVCKFQLCISNKITQYWLRGPSASTWATGRSQWVYGPCEHPAAAPTTQARYFSCWAHCFASLCFGTVVLFSGCLSIPVQLVLQNCRTPSNGCGGPPTSTCATHTHTVGVRSVRMPNSGTPNPSICVSF